MRKKKRSKKAIVYYILIAVFLLVFLTSAGVLGYQLWEYFQSGQTREHLQEMLSQTPTQSDLEQAPQQSVDKFAKLYSENHDFVGWVEIEDTPVSYPVVKGKDNEEYLYTTFYGKRHKLGTVFADYQTTITAEKQSDNTILYGHSAADGSYFMSLLKYKDLNYVKEHPFIKFDTLYEENDWVIMGILLIDAQDMSQDNFLYQNYIDFVDEQHYNSFIKQIEERNYYHFPVDTQYGDQFLTLSTCDYDFDDARMVVIARKLREGETKDSFDSSGITIHSEKRMPERWYQ